MKQAIGYMMAHVPIVEEEKKFDPNGHEYVDLGLPSGTLWATSNVITYNSGIGSGYNYQQAEEYAAGLGGSWRLPTKEEFEELLNNTTQSGFDFEKDDKKIQIHSYTLGAGGSSAYGGVDMWTSTPVENNDSENYVLSGYWSGGPWGTDRGYNGLQGKNKTNNYSATILCVLGYE